VVPFFYSEEDCRDDPHTPRQGNRHLRGKDCAERGGVGLSFYAFFANRNDTPELLMEMATWWIKTHKLDHFVKAVTIKAMLEAER
jgi:hypothetical protein